MPQTEPQALPQKDRRGQHNAGRSWGTPFTSSNNPRGKSPAQEARRKQLRAELVDALGGEERLNGDQRTMVDLVVDQTMTVQESRGSERTRAANVLLRMRAQLGLDAKRRQPSEETFAEALARHVRTRAAEEPEAEVDAEVDAEAEVKAEP